MKGQKITITYAFFLFCRFLGINKLGGSGFEMTVAVIIIVCILVYNAAFNIPMLMWANLFRTQWSGGLSCHIQADDNYVLAARIINFYAPLVITWIAYIGIIYKIKRSASKAISVTF